MAGDEKELHCHVTVRFMAGSKAFGPGLARLLRGVCQKGSLQGAARDMGMSYSKAWTIVKDAEAIWGFPLTYRCAGGRAGGSSQLTPQAQAVLSGYEAVKTAIDTVAVTEFERYFSEKQVTALREQV